MLTRRWISKASALAGIGVVAGLLTSCQKATDDTNLLLLEWNGYEKA